MDPSSWIFENPPPSTSSINSSGNENSNDGNVSNHFNNEHFLSFDSPTDGHNTPTTVQSNLNESTPLNSNGNLINRSVIEYHEYLNGGQILGSSLQNGHGSIKTGDGDEAVTNDWSTIPDLNDIDMNFFQPDQLLNTGMSDSQQMQRQQNNHHPSISDSPMLPTPQSFEVSSLANANSSNYLQNFQSPLVESSSSSINNQTSIRPDVVFTPLVSPAVTPMDAMMKNHNPNGGFFSPLTSPALEAKSPMKLKKSSSPEETTTPGSLNSSSSSSTKKYSKRKTPGNTPIVGPTIPGRIAKQSPILKAKRSSSYANNITHQQQQQLQQSAANSNSVDSDGTPNDDELMAPPKSRRTRRPSVSKSSLSATLKNNNNNNVNTNNAQPATPATLMNFKMDQTLSSSSSPIILPSHTSIPNNNSQTSSSSRRSSSTSTILQRSNSKMSFNDYDDSQDYEGNVSGGGNSSKKTSHKLAEQGRRNRMNQAIHDLGSLIPEELANTVAIPSKATTVELASQYIRNLLSEVEYLKDRLNADMMSNDSISPLETTSR